MITFMGYWILSQVPSAASFVYLLIPTGIFGIANGMVETSLMAELANLVDIRHCAMYGIVYAVADFVMCLGLSTGNYNKYTRICTMSLILKKQLINMKQKWIYVHFKIYWTFVNL